MLDKEKALMTMLVEVMLPNAGFNCFELGEHGEFIPCNHEVVDDLLSREEVYDRIMEGFYDILTKELEDTYGEF